MSLLHLDPRYIETSGVQETRAFTMKANGKAFKVLIDGLYSDKVRAVIRELCSNAYDAHVAAGVPAAPFELHLPTTYEPWFAVRDFGTSMTHDEVMGLYTTVFESSKENSATQVGKLGLGSKSPFAYTDTFTVTAWQGGEKRTYSAFIGDDYIPKIALMDRVPSDEPQGIEVTFPTKGGDEYAFQSAAQFTMVGFDVPPRMTGRALERPIRGTVLMAGTGWAVYSDMSAPHARQGCVVYPIDAGALAQNNLLRTGILIDFPIGSLEISASRESLGYDAVTVAAISERLAEISAEIYASAKGELDQLETVWAKMIFLARLGESRVPEDVMRKLRKDIFGSESSSDVFLDLADLGVTDTTQYSRSQLGQASSPKRYNSIWRLHVNPQTSMLMVFVDRRKPAAPRRWARIRSFASPQRFTSVLVLEYDSAIKDAAANIRARLDGAPQNMFVNIEDLPVPPSDASQRTPTVKARYVGPGSVCDWSAAEVNMKEGGYYIATSGRRLERSSWATGTECYELVNEMRGAGFIPSGVPVYGIPASNKSLTTHKGKWVEVYAHAAALVKAEEAALAEDYVRRKYKEGRGMVKIMTSLPAGSLLQQYATAASHAASYQTPPRLAALKRIADAVGVRIEQFTLPVIPVLTWDDVVDKYPLLRGLTEINRDNISHVLAYMAAIDNMTESAQAA